MILVTKTSDQARHRGHTLSTCTILTCMYVCVVITYSKSMDQPGKVANPARGQLNRENELFSDAVRAREFGFARRARTSRPASTCSFSILRLNLVLLLTGFLPISAAASSIIF